MIEVVIDGQRADVEQNINIAVNLQVADIEQPDVSKTNFTRALVIPTTPHNRRVMGFVEQPTSAERWNDADHTIEVYCDDTLLLSGRPILSSVQDTEYHIDVAGATMQWVRKAADTKLRDVLNLGGLTLTEDMGVQSRAEGWAGDVRLYPARRGERLTMVAPEDGEEFYTPRESSAVDLVPMINVSAVMREVFSGWTPQIIGSELNNALRSLIFSGKLPSDAPEVSDYNKFCIGRVFEEGVDINVPAYGAATLYQINIFNSDRLEDSEEFYNGGAFNATTKGINYDGAVDVAYDVRVRYFSPRIITNGKLGCIDTIEIMGERYKLVPDIDYTHVAEVMAAKDVRYLFVNIAFFSLTREDLGLGYDEDLSVWAVKEFHLFVGDTEVFEDTSRSYVWHIPSGISGAVELRAIAYNQDNPSDEREVYRTIPEGYTYYVPAAYNGAQVEVFATVRTMPIYHAATEGDTYDLDVKIINNTSSVRTITLANGWRAEAVFDKWLGKGHPLTAAEVVGEETTLLDVLLGLRHIYNLHFYTNEGNGVVYIAQGNAFISASSTAMVDELTPVYTDVDGDGTLEQVFDLEGNEVLVAVSSEVFPVIEYNKPFTIEELGQDKGASITFAYKDSAVRKGARAEFALTSRVPANPTTITNPLFASPQTEGNELVISNEAEQRPYYDGEVNFDTPIITLRSGTLATSSAAIEGFGNYAPTVEAYRKGRRITCYVYLRPFEVEAISQPFAGGKGFRSVWRLNINGDIVPCRLEKVNGYSPNTREAVKCSFITL